MPDFIDALPLYRLSKIFKRLGIELDRGTLAHWMIRCGELIQPLIDLITEGILEQSRVHMDETTVQVLKEPGKRAKSKVTCGCWAQDRPGIAGWCSEMTPVAAAQCPRQCSVGTKVH